MSARVANNGEIRAEVGEDVKSKATAASSAAGVSLTDYIGRLVEQDDVEPDEYLRRRVRQSLERCGLTQNTQDDWELWSNEGDTVNVYLEQS